MTSSCYDLRETASVSAALRTLKGFWKLWSACLLKHYGLSTLQGLLITGDFPQIRQVVNNFLIGIGSGLTLIRHDKFPEAPPYPRGGFLVGENVLNEVIEYFFSLGRIVVLYEPADPLLNGYNINLLFENDRDVNIEVVGPGFDMSDIKRGDLSPHESFSVHISPKGEVSKIKLLSRIDEPAYKESVIQRKIKIEEKLYSSPEPSLARKIRDDLGVSNDLEKHLKKIGSPLYNSQSYHPISQDVLRDTVEKIVKSGVINAFSTLSAAKFPFVFSTSFVNGGQKQVFWDIVSPTLKFEGLSSKK